ncbi:MAG: sigma-70 family RNA polymerase sigma factor [Luteimonas sp.]
MTRHDAPAATAEPGLDLWLGRVADGDRDAFEALYRASAGRLLGICIRVLQDRQEAEDALQDVYVRVWRKATQFDASRAGAATWLATVARNTAIDRLRARPAVQLAPVDLVEAMADDGETPLESTARADDRVRLDHCFETLEPRRRRLIRAAFFDGSTYEELARRAGAPLGSVKSWIRRGLLQLRACLEQ